MLNKKAQVSLPENTIDWLVNFVYLIGVAAALFGLIAAFLVTNTDVADIEAHVLMHRLQYSPEGIVNYDSATNRVYTGVVQTDKLSNGNLESALNTGEKELAARFVKTDLSEASRVVGYVNKETYLDWQPIAILVARDKALIGTGRKFPHEEVRYIYADEPSKLATVVITPNG